MVDDNQEVRRISWGEFFDFTHIFKSFLMVRRCFWQVFLAFAAIALVQFSGGLMDWVWSWSGLCAQPRDVLLYYQSANKAEYDMMLQTRRQSLEEQLTQWLRTAERWDHLEPFMKLYADNGGEMSSPFARAFGKLASEGVADATGPDKESSPPTGTQITEALKERIPPSPAGRSALWRDYEKTIKDILSRSSKLVDKAASQADDEIDEIDDKPQRQQAQARLKTDLNAARRALWGVQVEYIDARREFVFGHGIFHVLMNYENDCFGMAVAAVRRGQIFTGFGRVLRHQRSITPAHAPTRPGVGMDFYSTDGKTEPVGLLGWIFMMTQGMLWLGGNYPLYAAVFCLAVMSIWALFGGAIARIAAVYAAREETVPISAALRFARARFFSFLSAPIIPLLLILFCGVLMGLGGLLATLPLGDVAVGILFVLPMLLGCVIAFLSIGVVIGLPLMYPTIAVEGSDSFDAISRSLHYSFTRPWRYALYSLIAAVYGAVCYLFVRLFIFIALIATHFFVANGFFGAGTSSNPAPELSDGAGKMDLLWTKPTLDDLVGKMNTPAMGFTEILASFFIHLWVYLLAGLVAAFVLTMAVNCFTQIYFLLRRRVDAADLDDVYMEDPETDDDTLPEPADEPSEPSITQPEEPKQDAAESDAPEPDNQDKTE